MKDMFTGAAARGTTFDDLARVAGRGRYDLYNGGRNGDIRERFKKLVASTDLRTQREIDLEERLSAIQVEVKKLKAQRTAKNALIKDWQNAFDLLARAVNVLQEELRQAKLTNKRNQTELRRFRPPGTSAVVPLRPEDTFDPD